jgi:hypothetical protein
MFLLLCLVWFILTVVVLSFHLLNVLKLGNIYAECYFAECRYAECRGASQGSVLSYFLQ